jgi:molybdenum cofactor guanylyltransferase
MLCGIFVGGQARRMNGLAKGLLPAPDTGEPLVLRLARLVRELACEPVLVGEAQRYRTALPSLRSIDDAPAGIGPLGGLSALLRAASGTHVLALACDLPRLSPALIARLLTSDSEAAVLAPRAEHGPWEPLCARYRVAAVRPVLDTAIAQGTRSFQRLFAELRVEELPLVDGERRELLDWDSPDDVTR